MPDPPQSLVCTGLYADIASKQVADGVQLYAPAVPLWSDGADKQRWIRLPPGTAIDNSDPTEWVFPDGTKLWKQFSVGGHRVETRMWQKIHAHYWVDAVYTWNDDESAALQSKGGDIPLGSSTYHIPTQDECEKCHRGRSEHILGFEQVELGLPGGEGVRLADLVAQGRLARPPASTDLTIGDDGTGAAAPALGWLHANCGITCHNANPNSTGFAAGMFLRLDPDQLDGRPSTVFDSRTTTLGQAANAPGWNGRIRIIPGDATNSLLYDLISHRGQGKQMPPFATRIVDQADVALVQAWIARMPAVAGVDAGEVAPDAAPSADDASAGDDALAPPDVADAAPSADDASVGDDALASPDVADAASPPAPSDAGSSTTDAAVAPDATPPDAEPSPDGGVPAPDGDTTPGDAGPDAAPDPDAADAAPGA